jgi:hypothetical protein
MITVGDVDWVCLAPDRKVWKAPLNMVMCLFMFCKKPVITWLMEQQLKELFKKNISVTFNVAAQ